MSFLIYLLIFFIFPYFSTSNEYRYGIIRNASIELHSSITANRGHNSTVNDCNECLCDAFGNSKVDLFTCTGNIPNKFICQFYYFMPKRDEIKYPSYVTDIYVIKENATFGEKDDCCNTTFGEKGDCCNTTFGEKGDCCNTTFGEKGDCCNTTFGEKGDCCNTTFEEKDDCCNTTFLMNKITETDNKTNFFNRPLRSLAFNKKNNTFISIISDGLKNFITFDGSTLKYVSESNVSSFKTVGYNDGRYYLGKTDEKIDVYDETLNSLIYTISLENGEPLTIRFLDKNQMLVGTSKDGYIYKRDDNTKNFTSYSTIDGAAKYKPVHAFGVVNESAFYIGSTNIKTIALYTKDQNGSWTTSGSDDISYGSKTSDIVIDHKCKRIWIVEEMRDTIIIYDQNQIKAQPHRLKMNSRPLFNLMIFENYTLVMSHENEDGLSRIQPPLNCR